jgi:hypothetical protein
MTFNFLERLAASIVVLQRKRECSFYGFMRVLILTLMYFFTNQYLGDSYIGVSYDKFRKSTTHIN